MGAAKAPPSLTEQRLAVIELHTPHFAPLHLFTDPMQVVCVHAIVDQLPLLPQFLEYAAIQHRVQGQARGTPPNRVSEEVEAAILARALEHHTHGALRVPQELVAQGGRASSLRVRGV